MRRALSSVPVFDPLVCVCKVIWSSFTSEWFRNEAKSAPVDCFSTKALIFLITVLVFTATFVYEFP